MDTRSGPADRPLQGGARAFSCGGPLNLTSGQPVKWAIGGERAITPNSSAEALMGKLKVVVIPLVVVLFSSGLAGCAGSEEGRSGAGRDVDYNGSDCILIRTIRDYTPLDDSNLLIWGPAKRAYYVSLFRPAFDLRSSFRLSFSSRDEQLCPFGGDGIVVGSLMRDTVSIRSISRVSEEQAEQLLIRYGRKEPAEQQAPAPEEDVKGAEVEELG
ncbi:MAG: DUF6491 family protein [Woeseia sp.]